MTDKLEECDKVIVKHYSQLNNPVRFEERFEYLKTITEEIIGYFVDSDDKSIAIATRFIQEQDEKDFYEDIKVIPVSYIVSITKVQKVEEELTPR